MRSSSGPGDGVEHVGGGDEQHVRQVEVDLEVVVAERVVLRGVEHLEQRRRGVAPPVRCRPCRSRRAGRPGSSCRPRSWPGRCGRAGPRRRCAGGRGSRPRRARHRARPARTRARGRGRPTRRARSCRRREGRRGRRWRRPCGRCPAPMDHAPRAACAPPGTRRCGPSPRRGRCGRRRARRARRPGRGGRRTARPTAARSSCRARCGSTRAPGLRARALEPVDLALDRGAGRRRAARARRSWRGSSSATSSSSPSSPSSLRMAASCWRSRNSRCCFSMPSVTSWRIWSASSSSARASLIQATTFSRRASTSTVSSSSTLRSTDRSGHQPVVSASAPGRVDVAEQAGDAATADLLEQGAGRGPVLACELVGARGRRGVVDRFDLDPEGRRRCRPRRRRASARRLGPHHQRLRCRWGACRGPRSWATTPTRA